MPRILVTSDDPPDEYWCVCCGRRLEFNEQLGGILHDDVPHPPDMTFDEEDNPQ